MTGVEAVNTGTIIIFACDVKLASYLKSTLHRENYAVLTAADEAEIMSILQDNEIPVAALLLDIDRDGIQILKNVRLLETQLPIIMMSAAPSPVDIVEAMRSGASDFIAAPMADGTLERLLARILDNGAAPAPVQARTLPVSVTNNIFFGKNQYMQELRGMLGKIGASQAPVLIEGETGVGKEVIAREVHAQSSRSKQRFLKLNCAALPSELVESELFGYERGAFTGAFQRKPGMFELADGGTIFLDEIGDMDFKLQSKLLQVLQDHEFQRLGGKEAVRVNVRVIAATHRDLDKAIREERFREDLFYRLNVISIRVPALRERSGDIVAIAEFLLKKHSDPDLPVTPIGPALKQVLSSYHWPGNIRELENVIRKLLILKDPDMIVKDIRLRMGRRLQADSAPPAGGGGNDSLAGGETILGQVTKAKQRAEKTAILAALESTNWHRKKAALLLKIEYKALLYKMRTLEIEDKMAAMPFGGGV